VSIDNKQNIKNKLPLQSLLEQLYRPSN